MLIHKGLSSEAPDVVLNVPDVLPTTALTAASHKFWSGIESEYDEVDFMLGGFDEEKLDKKGNKYTKRKRSYGGVFTRLRRSSSWLLCGVSKPKRGKRSSSVPVFVMKMNEDTSSNSRRHRQTSSGHAFGPTNTSDTSIQSFLQKRIPPIRRAKSVKTTTGKENRPLDMTSFIGTGGNIRTTDTDGAPNMFMPTIESPDALDLTGEEDAIVRPLHYSILGREHCFEVITRSNGSRCFCCDSEGERETWIEKIKRTLNPQLDNTRRIEHQLSLGVQEAKGLPTKKKYFCEICLDRQLYARTTSKWKNDNTVLWGESFEFTSIPQLENITVHLYKDTDKKKKKDKDYMGLVNLTVNTLNSDRPDLGKWYALSTPSGNNKSKSGEQMAIRIKARFQSVNVLPSELYKPFAEYISTNYMQLCASLKNSLSVSQKDELARRLVRIMYATGNIKEYMTELVMNEIDQVEEESLIFRENTIGTKSVEAFLRLVGLNYLSKTLGEFVKTLFTSEEDCEVDESRLPPQAVLEQNQTNLKMCCQIALCQIVNSINCFPSELHEVFSIWRARCEACNRSRIAMRVITASLFLRLLCPAILNPSLFGLAYEIPGPKTARTLTLVAKVIQNLANRSRFGNKEEYMKFMDVFIRDQWDQMGEFIESVSGAAKPSAIPGFDGYIDSGKELAKLHSFFVEIIPTLEEGKFSSMKELRDIVSQLSEHLAKPMAEPESALSKLDKIIEDVHKSSSTGNILIPPSTSTPMAPRKDVGGSPSHSSSMMDMHDFTQISDYSINASYSRHNGSQASIPATGSYNQSNNIPASSYLASTENLTTSSRFHHSQSYQAPLSFSNPAYQLQQPGKKSPEGNSHVTNKGFSRGLSSPASLSMTAINDPQTDPTVHRHPDMLLSSKLHSSNKGPQPLSFHNPLQMLNPYQQQPQQHLETVFTTETVTYTTPAPTSAFLPKQIKRTDLDKGSSGNDSLNDSTCSRESSSSRESSTTDESTATSGTANNANLSQQSPPLRKPRKPSLPVHNKLTATPSGGSMGSKDEHPVVITATASSVSISSAHLKTGLKTQGYSSPMTSPSESPRRRTSGSYNKPSMIPTKKATVGYNVNNNNKQSVKSTKNQLQPRRSQPSLQLTKSDQGLVFELSEDPGLVTPRSQPVIQSSSAVVMPSNATRGKSSRSGNAKQNSNNSTPSRSNNIAEKQPYGGRKPSHHKVPHNYPLSSNNPIDPSLPLSTPEDQLSPEERTAQWILNNASPRVDSPVMKTDDVLQDSHNSKAMEQITQRDHEIERLRSIVGEMERTKQQFSRREAVLSDQIRVFEKRESRLQEKLKQSDRNAVERDQQIKQLFERLNLVEMERDALLDKIETASIESESQRKRISQLEIANARLLRAVNQFKDRAGSTRSNNSSTQSPSHPAVRRHRSRQTELSDQHTNSPQNRRRHHIDNSVSTDVHMENGNSPTATFMNGEIRVDGVPSEGSSSSSV